MNQQEDFSKHLDELIELFSELRAQHNNESLEGLDAGFFRTIDILLDNYALIRRTVPAELLNQLGSPIREIVDSLIQQLRTELGRTAENETSRRILAKIAEIDRKLTKTKLAPDTIDQLLDERANLMQQRDNKPKTDTE